MVQLEANREKFEQLGVKVAAMTVDEQEILAQFHAAERLGYPLLRDEGARHVNAYGVRNTDYGEGDPNYGLPHPGILFVSQEGEVLAKVAVPGYRKRPPFDALYATVAEILAR